jgi:branched-chain amino acid transport system substrate-binding protein
MIPKATADKIPVLSMAYGLSASAKGNIFPWIFNPPATYWDGASVFIRHVAEQSGGLDKLKGKKIGLIHLDAPFGKEPIALLEALGKKYGFELKLYPVAASDMQNQGSVWLNIRRDRPDWIYNQGWGAMNPTAVKEAAKNNFPMERLVGVWWAGGDDDARAGGDAAKGYKSLNFHAAGTNFPVIQDIQKHVVDKGLSKAPKEKVGENLYNRGVYNSMLIAEAVRTAQKITGKKAINSEDMRKGLEALDITPARLKEMGMDGFAAPVKLSCDDHNGHNKVYVAQWDGTKWVKGSEWMDPMKDDVMPLIDTAAADYAKSNNWPARSEACQKGS